MTARLLLICVATAYFLTGCAGTVARPTPESKRDTTGQYDGKWRVTVAKGQNIQTIQNWKFTCGDMSHEFDIVVRDSNIALSSDAGNASGYVSTKGRFKIYLPLSGRAAAGGTSDSSINNGERKLVLRGTLGGNNTVGFITYGIADFGYAGCTSKANFTRLDT